MTDLPRDDLPRLNDVAARDLDAIVRSVRFTAFQTVKLTFLSESWKQLGFASFEDWARSLPRHELPRDERKLVVIELDGLGMTQRQIAAAVGAGKSTVNRDLVPNGTERAPATARATVEAVPSGTETERLEAFADSLLTDGDKTKRAFRETRNSLTRAIEHMAQHAKRWSPEDRRLLGTYLTEARRALSGTVLKEVK